MNQLKTTCMTVLFTLSTFAAGCAGTVADTPEPAGRADTTTAATQQALTASGPESLVQTLADVTERAYLADAFPFDFASNPFHAADFVDTTDDDLKKQILALATVSGRDVLEQASAELANVAKRRAQAKGDTSRLRALAADMDNAQTYPALAALGTTVAKLGSVEARGAQRSEPSLLSGARGAEPPELKGIPAKNASIALYVTVEQLELSKRVIQTQLAPSLSLREDAPPSADAGAGPYVLRLRSALAVMDLTKVTMKELRANVVAERLGKISECGLLYYGEDRYGFYDSETGQVVFETKDTGKAPKACAAARTPYVASVEKQAQAKADATYAFEDAMIASWERLAVKVGR